MKGPISGVSEIRHGTKISMIGPLIILICFNLCALLYVIHPNCADMHLHGLNENPRLLPEPTLTGLQQIDNGTTEVREQPQQDTLTSKKPVICFSILSFI